MDVRGIIGREYAAAYGAGFSFGFDCYKYAARVRILDQIRIREYRPSHAGIQIANWVVPSLLRKLGVMRSRILYMVTTSDLIALMTAIEEQMPLKYTLTGFPDEPLLQQSNSFRNIPGFGISKLGKMILDDSFLLSAPDLEIKINPVPQTKGGIKYSIYTELNPKTLCFHPGGLFQGNTVISWELMKYSDEPEAKEMFKLFQREVKRQFKKHETYPYWLGKEAAGIYAAGGWLTNDVESPFRLSDT